MNILIRNDKGIFGESYKSLTVDRIPSGIVIKYKFKKEPSFRKYIRMAHCGYLHLDKIKL